MRKPFRDEWIGFQGRHPVRHINAGGADFRYFEMGNADAPPLVFLNGGLNTCEMWLCFLECHLLDDYRIIIFDFPLEADTDRKLVASIHEFLSALDVEKPVLVGTSFGGLIAQMYARQYRLDVGGLVLIATGGLDRSTLRSFRFRYALSPLLLWYMRHSGYDRLKPRLMKAADRNAASESDEDREYLHDMYSFIFDSYTREKDIHVTGLLADLVHQVPMEREDFSNLQGRMLLLFPSDDFFTGNMQQNLEELMLEPEIRRFHGNHASTILHPELILSEIVPFLRRIGY